jgi:hypothetical protein
MNFPEARPLTKAESLTPKLPLHSEGQMRRYRQRQRWISIAQTDAQFMAHWHRDHPEDVATMRTFWKEKQVERRAKRAGKL